MPILQPLLRPFRRYLRDESASLSVEAVMILPLLLWGYFGMFILFDAYRALAGNIRVSYTVSDMLTRETETVTPAYIEGLNNIQEVLTQSPARTVLRVTTIRFVDSNENGLADPGEHFLEWSYSTAGKTAVTEADYEVQIVPYLPPMPDSSVMVVVETWMAYVPFMNITLKPFYESGTTAGQTVFGPFYFKSLVANRPRFAGQLVWDAGS